jgi:hypothetical protein
VENQSFRRKSKDFLFELSLPRFGACQVARQRFSLSTSASGGLPLHPNAFGMLLLSH